MKTTNIILVIKTTIDCTTDLVYLQPGFFYLELIPRNLSISLF